MTTVWPAHKKVGQLVKYRSSYLLSIDRSKELNINTPMPGIQHEVDVCDYHNILSSEIPLEDKQHAVENHKLKYAGAEKCDIDCNNLALQELYESLLIKSILEDKTTVRKMLALNVRIFDAFKHQFPSEFDVVVEDWLKFDPAHFGTRSDVLYPVSQKKRDWSAGNVQSNAADGGTIPMVNKYVIKDMIGIDHDPTSIILSCSLLKKLCDALPHEMFTQRDYVYRSIQPRLQGYRRIIPRGKNKVQVGIANFDMPELKLSSRYYEPTPWMHPGRNKCDTIFNQGNYMDTATKYSIPKVCGMSSSTNYWVWTALGVKLDFTMEEVCLFILSAYTVLGGDGGHSLKEVLSAVTVTATYWREYRQYNTNGILQEYLNASNFAQMLYEATAEQNPIGESELLPLDQEERKEIGRRICNQEIQPYNDLCATEECMKTDDDKRNLDRDELKLRLQLEAFFAYERQEFPFGNYSTFLNKIPCISGCRKHVIEQLVQYTVKKC